MKPAASACLGATLECAIEAALGRRPQDDALFRLAVRHASALEGRAGANNERLEFLGDRVLGLVVAEHLYCTFPNLGEADFAPRLNSIVNRAACAEAARDCGAPQALELSVAEAAGGGREKAGILADAAEALVAAVYLDGGFEAARRFVLHHWRAAIAGAGEVGKDPKTALQEWAAAHKHAAPRYDVVSRDGPDHAPAYTIRASLEERGPHAEGAGGSKREAERRAAAALLARLGGAL